MALAYGHDISRPATNTLEAVQWLYYGYLGAIKEQNGAAMSLGRVSTFIDIYAQRDLSNQTMTESAVQEIIDDFVLKLRMARQLRTPDYNELFAGDPLWVTESLGEWDKMGEPSSQNPALDFTYAHQSRTSSRTKYDCSLGKKFTSGLQKLLRKTFY